MDSRGVELSLQTVVIAALSLLVLIILVLIMTSSSRNFQSSVNACNEKGANYECHVDQCDPDWSFYSRAGCDQDNNEVCCSKDDQFMGG